MAELIYIFDTVTGNRVAKKLESAHIADGAVLSGAIASGQIGAPHLAAGAVLSAHVGANLLATPHFANQGILSASYGAAEIGGVHIYSGTIFPGFSLSGDISLGANKIKTTNLSFYELDANVLTLRNAAADATRSLQLNELQPVSIRFAATNGIIKAQDNDGNVVAMQARDTGVGLVTVARLVGAAEPYFEIGASGNGVAIRTVAVTKAYNSTLFDAVALTDSDDVWAQPAGSVLLAVKIRLGTQFVAAGLTDLDITMGLAGDVDGLLVQAMNLSSDAVSTQYTTRGAYWNEAAALGFLAKDAATTWRAYATAVGANLSTLSAGSVDFYFTYLDIP